jgi:hypothetical protein
MTPRIQPFSVRVPYKLSFNSDKETLGPSVCIPLRIFDHIQEEKKRTLLDIDRSGDAADAAKARVLP